MNLAQLAIAGLMSSRKMSLQKRGFEYENEICQGIYEETGGDLIPERVGYSGNSVVPAPDIRIDDGTKVHAFELKKTSQDRLSVPFDPVDSEKDDIYQLIDYARSYPRTVVPYIGIRFRNRQIIIAKLWLGAPNDEAVVRSATKTAPTDVRLTRANNLSFHKPDTDEWPSQTAGDDIDHLLETIGYY